MKLIGLSQIIIALIVLTACDRNSGSSGSEIINDPVLAKVGEDFVRKSQVDVMLGRLSSEIRERNTTQLEATILQGIVRTRALASIAELQLNADERKLLDAKVLAFRDELLAKSYIQKNIVPQPVTSEMVNQYYLEHQEEYTTQGKVNFEYMATTSTKLDDDTTFKVLDAFTKAKNIDDWKLYVKGLKQNETPVEYKSANMVPTSINKVLATHIDKLEAGEVSDLVYSDYIYVVKVIKREPGVVKLVHEVSSDIRKKLAPQKLKQVLSQHVNKALQGITVEYMK